MKIYNYVKLDESKVRKIKRRLRKGDDSHVELGIAFNINRATIGQIARNETWKHVKEY